MNIKKKIVSLMSPQLKRRVNAIRYATLPTLRMRLAHIIRPPTFPTNEDGTVLIHLGCGREDDSRFINVDSIPFRHVHFIHDVTRLPMFPSNYANLVYASHVLEHVSYKYTVEVLREWSRVLKPGGTLRLAVPDFDLILKMYEAEHHRMEKIEGHLLGGHNYAYNFHYAAFNRESLTESLRQAGLVNIRSWDPRTAKYYSFHDWASMLAKGRYPISLNLEATKS
jgi:SAM-dependent methyltransferase